MKRANITQRKHAASYICIDNYTWIERNRNEIDEEALQRYLMKLLRLSASAVLRATS
jgi:hypothetical protein